MKKIRMICLTAVLITCFVISTINTYAATITSADYDDNKIVLTGTGDTQVQIVLFNTDNQPVYMTTVGVVDGKFSVELPEIAGLEEGDYTVKIADYDGKNVDSDVITVSQEDSNSSKAITDTGDTNTNILVGILMIISAIVLIAARINNNRTREQ